MLNARLIDPPFRVWFAANGEDLTEPWHLIVGGPADTLPGLVVCGSPHTLSGDVLVAVDYRDGAWWLTEIGPAGAHVEVVGLVVNNWRLDMHALHSRAEVRRQQYLTEESVRANARRVKPRT